MPVRETSRETYHQLEDEGHLERQQLVIVKAMQPGLSYSLKELSRLTGLEINAVSGRVNALKKLGRLVEEEPRPCGITQRRITPVRLP